MPSFAQQLEHARKERHVRTREDRQRDDIDIFLDGCIDDHLGRLMKACVDDLEARIAECAGDHLRAAVVAVEARLGDEDADLLFCVHGGKN